MRLTPKAQQRVRREFFPADHQRALALLTRWNTKSCSPGEYPSRMHAAALNVALGKVPALKRAIAMARTDYRDLLFIGDDPETTHSRGLVRKPGEGPTSPEEAAFLDGIRKKPADNTTRLVYADWLEERGEDRAAEYLRVLCRWLACHPDNDRQLIARERQLRKGLARWWLAGIRGIRVREKRAREKAD